MAKELAREGKIVADAPTGQGTIPDPRRYVFVEGCGEAGNNALAVAVKVNDQWCVIRSRRDGYRIARDGCFRAAIPLPGTAGAGDVTRGAGAGISAEGQTRRTRRRVSRGSTRCSRSNERFAPGPRLKSAGKATAVLQPGGPPFEIAGAMTGVLEMRGIRKAFPGVVALDGVDLTLNAGEVHMLLGENGAGKSTLMKILSGAYRKDSGEIRVHGQAGRDRQSRATRCGSGFASSTRN